MSTEGSEIKHTNLLELINSGDDEYISAYLEAVPIFQFKEDVKKTLDNYRRTKLRPMGDLVVEDVEDGKIKRISFEDAMRITMGMTD